MNHSEHRPPAAAILVLPLIYFEGAGATEHVTALAIWARRSGGHAAGPRWLMELS